MTGCMLPPPGGPGVGVRGWCMHGVCYCNHWLIAHWRKEYYIIILMR